MAGLGGRRILGFAAAIGLILSAGIAPPAEAASAGCPARPWTLADIVSVPGLWGEVAWPPEAARRVACFGDASIAFVARGGLLMAVFPGVDIAPAFGRPIYLASDVAGDGSVDLNAWVPPDIGVGPDDLKALSMTDPGLGLDGWHDVWWRGSGHFDDPAAAECRPDDGSSMIDDTPLVLAPAQAVELCRNEFVIDELHWLSVPPTDTLGSPGPTSPGEVLVVAGAVACLVLVAVLGLSRSRSRG